MRTKIVALVAVSLLALTACGSSGKGVPIDSDGVLRTDPEISGGASVSTFYVETVDGREIPCVYVAEGRGAGLSCDWSKR